VVVVAVLVALVVVWQAQPAAQAAPRVRRELPSPSPPGGPAGDRSASPSGGAAAEVVVHVVGAVHRPGLVRLPSGARVADAVDAAGGATAAARLASVNLARVVVDGEQVVVQRRGRPAVLGAPAVGAPATGAGPAAPVDLNTATLDALDGLPGIGPVLAQRILDWRTAHGRFSSVDELGEVSGIGEATLSDLAPLVVV
jgi:competence protein ComEA